MDGAVERGRGLAEGMAGRKDERPPPEMSAVPGTVSCRAPLLAFLIHLRFSDEGNPAVAYGERDMANLLRGACTPAWTAGRRERSRHTRVIRVPYACHTPTHCPAHAVPEKTKLALLPGAFWAPPCSIRWLPKHVDMGVIHLRE